MSSDKVRSIGFIIANASEEFFMGSRDLGGAVSIGWSRVPDLAERFQTAGKAKAKIREVDFSYPVWVLRLFETETQFRVSGYGPNVPPWLGGFNS